MSLRARLLLSIGFSMLVLWGATAAWMLTGLEHRMEAALDGRLAMSARMVASLMAQAPSAWSPGDSGAGFSVDTMPRGIACEIRSVHGDVFARTPDIGPQGIGRVPIGYGEVVSAGVRWRTFSVASGPLRVTTADRVDDRRALLRDVTWASVAPFAVALAGSLAILAFVIARELKPLERLRLGLQARPTDSLDEVPSHGLPAELRPLVRTLNGLLGQSALEIARERRFTSDAAHELRTPLTAITTHLQVARIARGTEAAQAVERAMEGASRLEQTLDALLTLSRVEGPFSWEEGPAPYADDVVREAVEHMDGAQVPRISVEGDVPHAALALPRALAVIALRNVLDNALRYSQADRVVIVRVARGDGNMAFTVIDHGPGLEESQLELAPRRFWRQGTGVGSGLGLSIVEAIARRFGGSLRLALAQGAGLQVELEFPELRPRPA